MKKKTLWVWAMMLLFLLPLRSAAQREDKAPQMTIPEYITKYGEMAKSEMHRSGVPASITLAQGILESTYGNSKLAIKANNHFGIKCGSNWPGPTFIQDDDTEKECFRKYESVLHSYADHSNFLKGKERYASLFKLDPKDYKGWANGLQKAGYATNPNYATLLIRMIEERDLHRFDTEEKNEALTRTEEDYFQSVDNKFYMFNGIKMVIAQPNELAMDMATKYDISLSVLLKYNDMSEGDYIIPGTKIYLGAKKSTGSDAFHQMEKGETMHSISQKEGIKLKALYKKNHMTWGQEAAEGEVLCLKQKCNTIPKLKTDEQIKEDMKERIQTRVDAAVVEKKRQEEPAEEIKIEAQEPAEVEPEEKPVAEEAQVAETTPPEKEPTIVEIPEQKKSDAPAPKVEPKETPAVAVVKEMPPAPGKTSETTLPKYHTVGPQETLFRIASNYGLTIDELKNLNGLTSSNISIGQRLIVGSSATAKPTPEKTVEEKPAPHADVSAQQTDKPVIQEKQPVYHTVGPQETMYNIATKYHISVAELKVMNDITGNALTIGQKLLVGYTDKVSGETKEPAKEGVAVPDEKPQETPGPQSYHKVQTGETLFSIAQKYGVAVEQLKSLNNLTTDDIQPGRILKLRE